MRHFDLSPISCRRTRAAISVLVALAVVAAGVPRVTASSGPEVFTGSESVGFFFLDEVTGPDTAVISEFLRDLGEVIEGHGSASISFRNADPRIAEMTATWIGDDFGFTNEYHVGADVVRITFPWETLSGEGEWIEIEANGVVVWIEAREPGVQGDAQEFAVAAGPGVELQRLAGALVDPEGFTRAVGGFSTALSVLEPPVTYMPNGCWWECGGCLLSLAGYGLTLASLIGACGVTAGAGCILAFIALTVGKASVLMGCSDCASCLQS